MQYSLLFVAALTLTQPDSLGPGDHRRTITVDHVKRRHNIHVPPKYDPKQPTPVVLALHGMGMLEAMMESFTGLNDTADKYNFVVVYPNGTGFITTWNAGQFPGKSNKTDDVKYLGKVLDDVESALNVDKKRVYVCGLSNGAMMSYRLASEMSERIAAIAPVAGTMAVEKYEPKRPVPVIHFHGTKDTLVPVNGPDKTLKFKSVGDTIMACVKANGCGEKPTETEVPTNEDKFKVVRKDYGKCKDGADVVLYIVEGGGHTWPGRPAPVFLGPTTKNISANELMWEFFKTHPLK